MTHDVQSSRIIETRNFFINVIYRVLLIEKCSLKKQYLWDTWFIYTNRIYSGFAFTAGEM